LGEPHLFVPPEQTMQPDERRLRLLQADARLAALSRLNEWPSATHHLDQSVNGQRQRRMDAVVREHHRDYRDLHRPGLDDGSSTNPQPARDRTRHLQHRLQTLLQYRNAMRRSSKAFWAQFDSH
jgi:hypothetical protein